MARIADSCHLDGSVTGAVRPDLLPEDSTRRDVRRGGTVVDPAPLGDDLRGGEESALAAVERDRRVAETVDFDDRDWTRRLARWDDIEAGDRPDSGDLVRQVTGESVRERSAGRNPGRVDTRRVAVLGLEHLVDHPARPDGV